MHCQNLRDYIRQLERAQFPVFTVDRITLRREPIYHSTYTGKPPGEPAVLGMALNELFIPLLQRQFMYTKFIVVVDDDVDVRERGRTLTMDAGVRARMAALFQALELWLAGAGDAGAEGRKASEKQAPSPRPWAMKAGTAVSTMTTEPQT